MRTGSANPGPNSGAEHPEPLAAYSDLRADAVSCDVDWYAAEVECDGQRAPGADGPA